jgi:hypothetical protein
MARGSRGPRGSHWTLTTCWAGVATGINQSRLTRYDPRGTRKSRGGSWHPAAGNLPFPAPVVGQARSAYSRVELWRAGHRRSARDQPAGQFPGAFWRHGDPGRSVAGPRCRRRRRDAAPGSNARMVSRSQHAADWAQPRNPDLSRSSIRTRISKKNSPDTRTGGTARARNPRSPSPICRGWGMGVPSPICRGSGVHPHPHPRFAGDRGSIPIPIPDSPESGIQLSTIENYKGVEFRLPQCLTLRLIVRPIKLINLRRPAMSRADDAVDYSGTSDSDSENDKVHARLPARAESCILAHDLTGSFLHAGFRVGCAPSSSSPE